MFKNVISDVVSDVVSGASFVQQFLQLQCVERSARVRSVCVSSSAAAAGIVELQQHAVLKSNCCSSSDGRSECSLEMLDTFAEPLLISSECTARCNTSSNL
jgi:hypothetical protein